MYTFNKSLQNKGYGLGFNFSLFNQGAFGILQYVRFIFYGLTSVLPFTLLTPFYIADSEKCQFCGNSIQFVFFKIAT